MQLNYFNRPYFENGAIKKISEVLEAHEIKNPLICTDPGLSSIGMTDKIRNLISNEFSCSFYEETPANPTEKAVIEALKIYKDNKCDGVVGFGGGSSMDLAKAVAPGVKHEIIGIRPGEKLHEQMIGEEDSLSTFEYDDYYKILPVINNLQTLFCTSSVSVDSFTRFISESANSVSLRRPFTSG